MDTGNIGIDLDHVLELATQIGTTGALGMTDLMADPILDYTIGIVVLISAA